MNLYNLSLTNPTAAREIYDGLTAQEKEDLYEELSSDQYEEFIKMITYNDWQEDSQTDPDERY